MATDTITTFQATVHKYYDEHGRHDLPWRTPESDGTFDPYKILVSELMLQQTQVPRVLPKFLAFTASFPSFAALANAPLSEVLTAWSGLGYNRRAKYLLQTAHIVVGQYGGDLPRTRANLMSLPGIGANTTGAIQAYAFNEPIVFIETNIRTVFIHHFFSGQDQITDAMLLPYIKSALPEDARTWYWALMDYGTHLKQTVGNLSRSSASYTKQSPFHGSKRRIRGQVLKMLTGGPYNYERLVWVINDERLPAVLDDLVREEFITSDGSQYRLRS